MSDHGFDHPVVYDLESLRVKNQRLPMMYNHRTEVGHTTRVDNSKTDLSGIGILSVDNKASKRIANAAAKEFPYQASMGIDAGRIKVEFHPRGMDANGQSFKGPHYLLKNAINDEMTITPIGRDTNTSVSLLNSRISMHELNRIKNAATRKTVKKAAPSNPAPVKKKVVKQGDPTPTPVRKKVKNSKVRSGQHTNLPQRIDNDARFAKVLRLIDRYPKQRKMILNSVEDGESLGRIANMAKMRDLQDQLPRAPRIGNKGKGPDILEARLLNALCVNPEKTLAKKYGKEVRDQVMDLPRIGLKELLVEGCYRLGQRFTGHSDINNMCDFLNRHSRARILNLGFSSFDLPNMFKRVTEFVMEESWKIEDTFAPSNLFVTSNNDFKPTERIRPSGGQMWEGLDPEGKIKHGSMGPEKRYTTELDTKAQMLVFNREMIENDDLDSINEIIQLMLEGAIIVPDYKLLQHMLQANNGFFKASGEYINDFSGSGAELNETNLTTIFTAAQKQVIEKGRISWVNRLGNIWDLVIPPELERTAWELLNQTTLIGPTGTRQGSKNYWAGKLNVKVFNQLSNTTMNTKATDDMWFLWPQGARYAPFAITYLRGKRSPTVEVKEVPADMLGFAIRGYFDVEVNDREPTAIIRARPTGTL